MDISGFPAEELETGSGEVINAERDWIRLLAYRRSIGRERDVTLLLGLLHRIEAWRDFRAVALKMAPAAVLPRHMCKIIAISLPRTVEALRKIGVCVTGAEDLAELVSAAARELQPRQPAAVATSVSSCTSVAHQPPACHQYGNMGGMEEAGDELLLGIVTPTGPWEHAVYKPRKASKANGGGLMKPPWELSYDRFMRGTRYR